MLQAGNKLFGGKNTDIQTFDLVVNLNQNQTSQIRSAAGYNDDSNISTTKNSTTNS